MESSIRTHIHALCEESRAPNTPGHLRAQEYIRKFIRGMGLEPKDHYFSVMGADKCNNIYAESHPGTPSPVILIGAHYETRGCSGPGADDNASAVAVALETAKILLEQKGPPFVLVLFDMEESYKLAWQGLQGSKAFASFYKRPLDRVVIMDLVGGTIAPHFENVFLQFGGGLPQLTSKNLSFFHLPMVILEPLGTLGARSDYNAFRKRNIPFSFFSSGTPWYYHTEFDTPDILNYSKMAGLTESLAASLLRPPKPELIGGNIESFLSFATTFMKTLELQHPLFEKLLHEQRLPSRLEMVRLYKHILPTLRKYKTELWNPNRGADDRKAG